MASITRIPLRFIQATREYFNIKGVYQAGEKPTDISPYPRFP